MRHGSLQFYPRKRASKMLPSVNWNGITRKDSGLLGFIGYKAGMKSAYVKDNTPNSMTKNQRITIPVTIIECPALKIFSIRFYKEGKVAGEILNSNLDKELKSKLKIPKSPNKKIDDFSKEKFDDLRIIVYSQVKKIGFKKTPDLIEVSLSGSLDEKVNFAKEKISKEISVKDFLNDEVMKQGIIDVRGVTKGKGFQGSTKRFGLTLQSHKSEKGVRGPGSGGPWHPPRVEFSQPMAGQMGYFTRVVYNNKILFIGDKNDGEKNFKIELKNYGKIKNDFLVIYGSVQGPSKRQLVLTLPLRAVKNQIKKNYELLELR